MSLHGHAWLNRVASAGGAATLVLGSCACIPEPAVREQFLFTLVLALGYGHLIGAALPAWRGGRSASAGLLVVSGFCAYTGLAHRVPGILPLLLVTTVWHTVENDLALRRTLGRSRGAAGMPRGLRAQLPSLIGTVCATLLFLMVGADAALGFPLPLAPPSLGRHFPELFAGSVLYHLLSWMGVVAFRGGIRRLCVVHGLPLALALALVALPGELAHRAREFAFSPVVYLYWSVAHVAQTVCARLREA